MSPVGYVITCKAQLNSGYDLFKQFLSVIADLALFALPEVYVCA